MLMDKKMTNSVITISPDIQSGSPVFAGTRVPVKSFFDYISSGETIDKYLEDYPYIRKEQVYSLLSLLGKILLKNMETIFHEDFD